VKACGRLVPVRMQHDDHDVRSQGGKWTPLKLETGTQCIHQSRIQSKLNYHTTRTPPQIMMLYICSVPVADLVVVLNLRPPQVNVQSYNAL